MLFVTLSTEQFGVNETYEAFYILTVKALLPLHPANNLQMQSRDGLWNDCMTNFSWQVQQEIRLPCYQDHDNRITIQKSHHAFTQMYSAYYSLSSSYCHGLEKTLFRLREEHWKSFMQRQWSRIVEIAPRGRPLRRFYGKRHATDVSS